jgi:cell division protein FtsB
MGLEEIFRLILIIIVFMGIYYVLLTLILKRNIIKVIKIFERKKALNAENAVLSEELGIKNQGFLEKAIKGRKNEMLALRFLSDTGAIKSTYAGRVYLSKNKLATLRKEGNFITRFIIPNLENS